MDIAHAVAEALVDIGGVGFSVEHPITFKSGILSPMYMDNRRFPSYPKEWRVVLDAFQNVIASTPISFDVVAGIETAGIPHSAALGALMMKPSVFVRKAAKDHGTKKMVEGGDVASKNVLLIEDLVTTGGSSLHGVRELRAAGATVTTCLVIVSYGLEEARTAFVDEKVQLTSLTDVPTVLEVAHARDMVSDHDMQIVHEWYRNPREWGR